MSTRIWSAPLMRFVAPSGDRPEHPTGRRYRSAVAVATCLVLLAGCRLDLAAEAVVDTDGGGTVSVAAGFDAELLQQLDELGVDPTAELEAVASSTPGWEAVRVLRDDGGLEVVASRAAETAADIGGAFRELSAGLSDQDPALLIDLEVTRDDEGATAVSGRAELRAPTTAGVSLDGVAMGPDERRLAELVATSVDAQLRIRLPGPVVAHDGDRLEDRTVVWDLPSDQAVDVRAEAEPPRWWAPLVEGLVSLPAAALVGAGAVVVLLAGGGLHKRRSRVADSG
jgi:hypothetical protein